jgi:sulfonate transport system substrate-binding protein
VANERTDRMRPVSVIAAACFAIGALLAVPNAAAAQKLRVGVNLTTIETLPIWLIEKEPLAASIVISGGGIPLLNAGSADVATHAETQAVRYSPVNPDIRVILTVAEYAYHIVARRSAGIGAAADLRGRKIATALNTSANFYLVKTLQTAGLTEKDVTVVGMAPPDMPAALARGDVDAVSIWEPAAEQASKALGADAVILQGVDYKERFDLNTTAPNLADPAKRAAIVDVVRAIIRTSRTVRERPKEVQPVIAAKLGLPVATVAASWSLFRFPAALPDDLLDAMVEQEPWMAKNQNRAPRSREALAKLIDASVLRDAQAEPAATGTPRR